MKKEISALILTVFLIGFISAATLFVDNTVSCDDNTLNSSATPYCEIQEAVDDASNGDVINVTAGTYTDLTEGITSCPTPFADSALVCITKSLRITGNNVAILDGGGAFASGFVVSSSNVIIEGFQVRDFANPGCCTGGIGSGVLSWNTNVSNVTVQDNWLHDLGWNGVLSGSDDGTTQSGWIVQRNTIADSDYAGIELTNAVNSKVLNNTVTIGDGIVWDPGDSGVGIEIAVRDHGTGVVAGTNNLVENNKITGDAVAPERAGINILSRAYSNPASAVLQSVTVRNNSVTGSTRGIFVTAETRLDGDATISALSITKNILDGNEDGIVLHDFLNSGTTAPTHSGIAIGNNTIINSLGPSSGIHLNPGTSGSGIEIHRNNIVGNLAYGLNHEGTGTLNATLNWWGNCTGPDFLPYNSGSGDEIRNATGGPVLFNPWIGICIADKIDVQCAEQSKNVVLSANVSSFTGTSFFAFIEDVWFSYTINGTNFNKTGSPVGNSTYNLTINNSELIGGQNVSWNVYANDTSGFVVSNGLKTFYVRNATRLGIVPFPADGLNGWWVTEPVFSLTPDAASAGNDSWYQWDSDNISKYTGPFNLDDIPNAPPKESAGTLELNWWTDFGGVCGNETVQSQTLFIDLKNPFITNLQPSDGATVFNNLRPKIGALLDEVYQSNSGIDIELVSMSLNSVPVILVVNSSLNQTGIDAVIEFAPSVDLPLGKNNVTINATDDSGRNSLRSWSFFINTTAVFNMTISSPKNITYNTRKIPFNVSLNGEVEKLEYINYNDKNPRFKILCRNCNQSGYLKSLNKTLLEGKNLIGIKATDFLGQTNQQNISLFIDSKAPKISKTEPAKNKVTNGSFSIKYTEENVKEVLLSWNPTVNLTSQCNTPGKNVVCDVQINNNLSNFSAFNGQVINYSVNMTDIANKTASTKPTMVLVDTTEPIINFFNHSISGKTVEFVILITEANFDEINYVDLNESNPKAKNLCTKLDDGVCNKKKTFKTGAHNLTINVLDDAGNAAMQNLNFIIS